MYIYTHIFIFIFVHLPSSMQAPPQQNPEAHEHVSSTVRTGHANNHRQGNNAAPRQIEGHTTRHLFADRKNRPGTQAEQQMRRAVEKPFLVLRTCPPDVPFSRDARAALNVVLAHAGTTIRMAQSLWLPPLYRRFRWASWMLHSGASAEGHS